MAAVFTPHIGVAPIKGKSWEPRRPWNAFTYKSAGKRLYYIEGLQMLGMLFWLVAGGLFGLGWWLNGL